MAGKARDESARKRQLAGLKPVKPGEVRNPTGKNQWTYRADFERSVARLMDAHGESIAERLVHGALRGKDLRLMLALLERVFPRVERHEHSGDIAVSADLAALEARLARAAGARSAAPDSGEPEPG